jgi:ribonucleoside-diphosphate reductase alpha chain
LYRIADDLEELKIKVGKMPSPDQERATPTAEVRAAVEMHVQEVPAKPKRAARKSAPDLCPHCGQATYVREEGCQHCTSCGHNACG